ncbi:hypothetical protein HYPSUDRAFT_202321 [Hypholoma sublateritium FD-334 SS-4]|uniref:Uncharacterized protein n=1 Tax=Hypholoma sublateritium (strain FD-334 SS-4) TaxID=945553 RepID=A0A0D2NTX3_HYPSF|nr:hypothetical protein HYPSUDRAFT_202321 [Hypholoma sublateritium FD-334 SS-4]
MKNHLPHNSPYGLRDNFGCSAAARNLIDLTWSACPPARTRPTLVDRLCAVKVDEQQGLGKQAPWLANKIFFHAENVPLTSHMTVRGFAELGTSAWAVHYAHHSAEYLSNDGHSISFSENGMQAPYI